MGARPGLAPAPAKNLGTAIALGLFSVGVHLLVNALGSHGYFRDELYYLACARHVSTGYVDQPPLSILILAGASLLLGTSVFAIRIVPAITSGLSVIVLCLLVRRMGGGRAALVLAALPFLASPLLLGARPYYSMNGLDVLFWLLAAYALLRIVDQPTLPAWLWLGAIIGVGLLNKISVLWLIAGVGMAVLLTGLRRQLRLPGPYLAGLLALLIFAPYIVWNLRHGLPHLEFLHNATEGKYSSLTRFRFLTDQWLDMNPATFLVSLPGLWWCLLDRDGRRYRALGVVFLTVLAVLMANPPHEGRVHGRRVSDGLRLRRDCDLGACGPLARHRRHGDRRPSGPHGRGARPAGHADPSRAGLCSIREGTRRCSEHPREPESLRASPVLRRHERM